MDSHFKFPIKSVTYQKISFNLPRVMYSSNEFARYNAIITDLRTGFSCGLYHLQHTCRYRLYDRNEAVVFTSRGVTFGDPVPEV